MRRGAGIKITYASELLGMTGAAHAVTSHQYLLAMSCRKHERLQGLRLNMAPDRLPVQHAI